MTTPSSMPPALHVLSAEFVVDLSTLYHRPLHKCGNTCWLTPRQQIRVDGKTVRTRYFLFEWVTGHSVPASESLVAGPVCSGLKDCVNPLHQIRLPHARKGRKPGGVNRVVDNETRPRKTFAVSLDGPSDWAELLLLPSRLWPEEARTQCWEWTGYTQHIPAKPFPKPVPYIGNVTAARHIWETYHRLPVPEGKLVTRTCRNGMCVNPAHLALASRKLNKPDEHASPIEPQVATASHTLTFEGGDASGDRELLLDLVNNSYPDRPPTEWLGPFTRTLLDEFVPRHVRALLRDLAQDDRQYRELLEHIRWS